MTAKSSIKKKHRVQGSRKSQRGRGVSKALTAQSTSKTMIIKKTSAIDLLRRLGDAGPQSSEAKQRALDDRPPRVLISGHPPRSKKQSKGKQLRVKALK